MWDNIKSLEDEEVNFLKKKEIDDSVLEDQVKIKAPSNSKQDSVELEKTTILAALVWVAGILAEIMFRDTFSSSILGICFSLILAAIVIVATYFVIDGFSYMLANVRKNSEKKQKEYQEKMFAGLDSKLDEELKLQRVLCENVSNMGIEGFTTTAPQSVQNAVIDQDVIEQAIKDINENTIKAAKLVAKYQIKNTDTVIASVNDVKEAISEIENNISSNQVNQSEEKVVTSVVNDEKSEEILSASKEILEKLNEIHALINEVGDKSIDSEEISSYIDKAIETLREKQKEERAEEYKAIAEEEKAREQERTALEEEKIAQEQEKIRLEEERLKVEKEKLEQEKTAQAAVPKSEEKVQNTRNTNTAKPTVLDKESAREALKRRREERLAAEAAKKENGEITGGGTGAERLAAIMAMKEKQKAEQIKEEPVAEEAKPELPEPEINAEEPTVEIPEVKAEETEFEMSEPEIQELEAEVPEIKEEEIEIPEPEIEVPQVDISELEIEIPEAKEEELEFELSDANLEALSEIELPKLDLEEPEIELPEPEISEPDIEIPDLDNLVSDIEIEPINDIDIDKLLQDIADESGDIEEETPNVINVEDELSDMFASGDSYSEIKMPSDELASSLFVEGDDSDDIDISLPDIGLSMDDLKD